MAASESNDWPILNPGPGRNISSHK